MPDYPIISKGLGKLTPGVWARLMRMLQSYESSSPRDERAPKRPATSNYFLAEITKAKVVAVQDENDCDDTSYGKVYKFIYAWREVQIDGQDAYTATYTEGVCKTSTYAGDEFYYPAMNALEIRNECDYATGIHISGGAYLATFYPLPFGGATSTNLTDLAEDDEVELRHDLITVVHAMPDEQGTMRYLFAHMMQHDGGCET